MSNPKTGLWVILMVGVSAVILFLTLTALGGGFS